jgi:Lipocalin-like domain
MFKAAAIAAIAVGSVLFTQAAMADDAGKVVGIWKLVSFENEFQDGSPRRPVFGARPTGYIIFTAQGRMMGVIEGEGRKVASTDEERAALLRTMFAYTGTYRLEDGKWVTKVDVSWNPAWNGTDQVRFYKIDGDRMQVTSAWAPSVNLSGSPITRGVLMWERVK